MEAPSEINTETLILEIQNRPAIWDMTTREYSDRIAKKRAWEEISTLFIKDFETKTTKQKNEEAAKLQKKWKGIRDCYTKHKSKKTKSGSEATMGRGYIYAPYLSFLNPLSETRPKANFQKESQDSCPYSRRESDFCNVANANVCEDEKSEKLIKILTTRMMKKEEKKPDYNFFMSLLDDFSAINSDLKMDAKMEMMGVIKKYVQMSKYSGQNSNYSSGHFTSMDSSSHTLALATSQNLNTSSPAHSHVSDSTQESIYENLFGDDYGDN